MGAGFPSKCQTCGRLYGACACSDIDPEIYVLAAHVVKKEYLGSDDDERGAWLEGLAQAINSSVQDWLMKP